MNKIKSLVKKKIKHLIPENDVHGFKYTVTELVGMWENSKISTEWHGKILNEEIFKYKTSDTVFILGSGPSINDITRKQWKFIANHDSIGFNYWFAHDFVPNVYVFQAFYENMFNILKDKSAQYRNIPFIIRGSIFSKFGFKNLERHNLELLEKHPLYYLREYPIHSRCSIDPNLLIKYFEALGLMPYGNIAGFIPKLRGTLGLLIVLCYQMGYRRIVLCGMDMHSDDHFWDYEPYNNMKNKYSLPEKGVANIVSFTDKNRSSNTVPVYVKALRDWMYKKNSVEIFIINKKTVLYPDIPVFNMKY